MLESESRVMRDALWCITPEILERVTAGTGAFLKRDCFAAPRAARNDGGARITSCPPQ